MRDERDGPGFQGTGSGPLRVLVTVNDVFERAAMVIAMACFATFVTVTTVEAFSRYVFSYSILWTNELARLAFLWSVFLAAAVAFRKDAHLQVDVFNVKAGGLADRVQAAVSRIVTLLVAGVWLWFGGRLVVEGSPRRMPMLDIPLSYGWASIAVMGLLTVLFTIEKLVTAPGAMPEHTPASAEGRAGA